MTLEMFRSAEHPIEVPDDYPKHEVDALLDTIDLLSENPSENVIKSLKRQASNLRGKHDDLPPKEHAASRL